MAERFALMDVADMHFHHGGSDAADAVAKGYAGVGVATCIEDDAVGVEPHFLQFVYEFTLYVGLKVVYDYLRVACSQVLQVFLECGVPVDVGFALSQEVEVGTVDNGYFHRV